MLLGFSHLSTVEGSDAEIVQRDRERLGPVSSIMVAIAQARTITADATHVPFTTQTTSTGQKLEQDDSTEVALKAVILDGRDLTHSTTHVFTHPLGDLAKTINSFKCIKSTVRSERPPDSRQSNRSKTRYRPIGDFHFHYLSHDSLAAKGIIPCAQQPMPAHATDGRGAVPRPSNVSFLQGGKVVVDLMNESD